MVAIIITSACSKKERYVFTVSQDGTCDFTTIQGALDSIDDKSNNVVIVVKNGVYYSNPYIGKEQMQKCGKRNIAIVGENKDSCIIINNVGYYRWQDEVDYSALRISGNVYLHNLTFISSSEKYFDEYKRNRWTSKTNHRAYCLHVDDGATEGSELYIENCNFYNDHFTCIGFGLRKDFTLRINKCYMESTFAPDSDGDIFGTLYGHPEANRTRKGQRLIVENCTILNKNKNHAISLLGNWGNRIEVVLNNNRYVTCNIDSALNFSEDFFIK